MGLAHLAGRRTGRPKGSRTSSRVRRDLRWAYRNLHKPDAKPPSEGARLWAEYARTCPRRFLDRVLRADLLEESKAEGDALEKAIAGPAVSPASGSPAGVVAARTRRTRRLFVPEGHLAAYLTGGRAPWVRNLPNHFEVIACEVDRERGGVVLTLFDWSFEPAAAGAQVPELAAEFDRPPAGR